MRLRKAIQVNDGNKNNDSNRLNEEIKPRCRSTFSVESPGQNGKVNLERQSNENPMRKQEVLSLTRVVFVTVFST